MMVLIVKADPTFGSPKRPVDWPGVVLLVSVALFSAGVIAIAWMTAGQL